MKRDAELHAHASSPRVIAGFISAGIDAGMRVSLACWKGPAGRHESSSPGVTQLEQTALAAWGALVERVPIHSVWLDEDIQEATAQQRLKPGMRTAHRACWPQNRLNPIHFPSSRNSDLIQLADSVAYVYQRWIRDAVDDDSVRGIVMILESDNRKVKVTVTDRGENREGDLRP